MKDPHVRRLPIRSYTVLTGDGSGETQSFVFCPLREHTEPMSSCAHCPRLLNRDGLEQQGPRGAVVCELPAVDGKHVDAAEVAARISVGEVMRRELVAVTSDVAVETVARLLTESTAGSVTVVDARRAVIGVISKTDLLRERDDSSTLVPVPRELGKGFHIEPRGQLTAGDVMSCAVRCLPEDARLSHAIGLMASEGLAHVPVVNPNGALVGVLESDDVLAWFAHKIGYLRGVGPEGDLR